MVDKTTRFVLGHDRFKTIGCSRTDAKVSALHFAFELITPDKVPVGELLRLYNKNFPQDIRTLKVEIPDEAFNIISSPKLKEYVYLFANGEKTHPFSAPNVVTFPGDLEVELMKQGAAVFEGTHDFRKYCTQPSEHTIVVRTVDWSRIIGNDLLEARHFPERTFAYHIGSKGFMRNQVRLMMGQLVLLGQGKISLPALEDSIANPSQGPLDYIAPASGLVLNRIDFL